MDGATINIDAAAEAWACVEIFGHRRHYGRIAEVERFGTKMLRIDVPSLREAPTNGEPETFETFFYGGGSIFSLTPMTEEAARAYAERDRPRPFTPRSALPLPDEFGAEFDDEAEGPSIDDEEAPRA